MLATAEPSLAVRARVAMSGLALVAALFASHTAGAQVADSLRGAVAPVQPARPDVVSREPARSGVISIDVGSQGEAYLRYLQSLGLAPLGQIAIRPWGPREVARLVAADSSPASPRVLDRTPRAFGRGEWQLAPLAVEATYNTTFPFGTNDGPQWRGRGLTAALEGGLAARLGMLTVELRPTAFWAQNAEFPLMVYLQPAPNPYADPLNPTTIDRPQRFGSQSFGRVSPGASTVRLDAAGLTIGASTANQWWGPMAEWPYLLSNNAEGFPHLFAGTSQPLNVGIGRLHAHVMYGDLRQSAYAGIPEDSSRRFASGLIVSFMPRGLEGLEVGAARFFHQQWPAGGLTASNFRKPLEDFLKRNVTGDQGSLDRTNSDNQLASVFARWTFPRSGVEVYGEFGREDHSYDERDFILSPDHEATLGMGLRKAWRTTDGLTGVRFEFMDLDPSNLGLNRAQGSKYLHGVTRQGHTERGQLLGAAFGSDNGAATSLAWERFGGTGAHDLLSLTRMIVRESGYYAPPVIDVQYVATGERTRVVQGHRLTYGLAGVFELNRYLTSDAFNLMGNMRFAW